MSNYWILPGARESFGSSSFILLYRALPAKQLPNPRDTLVNLNKYNKTKKLNPTEVMTMARSRDNNTYDMLAQISYQKTVNIMGPFYFQLAGINPCVLRRIPSSGVIRQLPTNLTWLWTAQELEEFSLWNVQQSIDNSKQVQVDQMLRGIQGIIRDLDLSRLNEVWKRLSDRELEGVNFLEWLLKQLSSSSIHGLHHSQFQDISEHPKHMEEISRYLIILTRLVKRFPQLITDEIKELIEPWGVPIISNLLDLHTIKILVPEDEECYICATPDPHQLIDTPCLCRMKIHLECLIKMTYINGIYCMTCRGSFNHRIKDDQIYYPHAGIYLQLDGTYLIIPEDQIEVRLHQAILHLEVQVATEIIEKIEDSKLKNYLLANRTLYSIKNNQIRLRRTPYPNLMSDNNNLQHHQELQGILNNKIQQASISLTPPRPPQNIQRNQRADESERSSRNVQRNQRADEDERSSRNNDERSSRNVQRNQRADEDERSSRNPRSQNNDERSSRNPRSQNNDERSSRNPRSQNNDERSSRNIRPRSNRQEADEDERSSRNIRPRSNRQEADEDERSSRNVERSQRSNRDPSPERRNRSDSRDDERSQRHRDRDDERSRRS